ncbi:hypothetical protein HYU14_05470 [Candidatus Woesearchaeota archaeon]|nr:hypothetical protein [Candidatus Woesearchaeota archaeon]
MGAAAVMSAPSFVRGIHSANLEDRLRAAVVLINQGSDLKTSWPKEHEKLKEDLLLVSTPEEVDILEGITDPNLRINTYDRIISKGDLAGGPQNVVSRMADYPEELKRQHAPQLAEAFYLAVKRNLPGLNQMAFSALEQIPSLGAASMFMAKLAGDSSVGYPFQSGARDYLLNHTDELAKEEFKANFIPAYAIIAAKGSPEQAEKALAALREIPVPELRLTKHGHYETDPLLDGLIGILKESTAAPTQTQTMELLFQKYAFLGLEAAAKYGNLETKGRAIKTLSGITFEKGIGRGIDHTILESQKALIYERMAETCKFWPTADGVHMMNCLADAIQLISEPEIMLQTFWRVYKRSFGQIPVEKASNALGLYIGHIKNIPNPDERNEIYSFLSKHHPDSMTKDYAKKQLPLHIRAIAYLHNKIS